MSTAWTTVSSVIKKTTTIISSYLSILWRVQTIKGYQNSTTLPKPFERGKISTDTKLLRNIYKMSSFDDFPCCRRKPIINGIHTFVVSHDINMVENRKRSVQSKDMRNYYQKYKVYFYTVFMFTEHFIISIT